jgi:hypothetical protein
MDVTSAYLASASKFPAFMEAIQKAPAPPRVTVEFLNNLGFKSTNDRAFIPVLKGLGFLDPNGVPTKIYRDYRDKEHAKQVLARQIKIAYKGLFATDEHAEKLSRDTVKNRLATITNKDTAVIEKMATTFSTLVGLADFRDTESLVDIEAEEDASVESPAGVAPAPLPAGARGFAFSHTIYINLPASTDPAVYDAIFKSLRENLT